MNTDAFVFWTGDTWEFEYQIVDSKKIPLDVTDWEIRAEIYKSGVSIKKANSKVVGGSNSQIAILDTNGTILITVDYSETLNLAEGIYKIEVEITSPTDKKFTVISDNINVRRDKIRWENK